MFQERCPSIEIIDGCIRNEVHRPIIGGLLNCVEKVCGNIDVEI